jgi:hypothetical protein
MGLHRNFPVLRFKARPSEDSSDNNNNKKEDAFF